MRPLLLAACLAACAGAPRPALPPGEAAARAALADFAGAAEAGRWEEAFALLSARWRARTTPARLAEDWRTSGPVGPEAAARVRVLLAAGAPLALRTGEATLAVGEGKAARLVLEAGAGWRVDSLE